MSSPFGVGIWRKRATLFSFFSPSTSPKSVGIVEVHFNPQSTNLQKMMMHPSKIGFKLDSPIPCPLDANKKKTFQNAT
jgi:hypothetical protein